MAVSFVLLGYFVLRLDMAMILLALAVYGVGNALFISPNNIEVMGALPRQKTGIASSTSALVRNLGMAIGVSLGSLFMTLQLSATGNIFGMAPSGRRRHEPGDLFRRSPVCRRSDRFLAPICVNVRKTGLIRFTLPRAKDDSECQLFYSFVQPFPGFRFRVPVSSRPANSALLGSP